LGKLSGTRDTLRGCNFNAGFLWSDGLRKKNVDLFSSPEKRSLVLCLFLALSMVVLYNPVAHFQFVNFDDDRYLTDNPHVNRGLSWRTISWSLTSIEESNWHPLTWLSHALDCQLFHLNPAGHHYVNLLFHIANVLLIFLLLQKATGFTWRSFMVAALFGVHPLNVESVAWVAERKNLLCTFFFLLTLGAYGWYARRPSAARYFAVGTLFTLALMSKPMAITLPFVLLLLDYWPLGRMGSQSADTRNSSPVVQSKPVSSKQRFSVLVVEKLPLFALSAVSAIITMRAQQAGGAVRSTYSLWTRLGNAASSYVSYLGKAIVPIRLAPLYPHPGNSLSVRAAVVSGLFLAALTITFLRAKTFPYLIVGWLWFLGILVPMIGLVQVGEQSMADRYTYLALIGVFVIAVWIVGDWAADTELPASALAVGGILVLGTLSTITHFQAGYWQDSVALWTHAIAVTGPNFVAQNNLGGALVQQGQYDEAMSHFKAAAQINPQDAFSQLNIGVYEALHGNTKDAVARYQFVLSRTADARFRASAFSALGSAFRTSGDYARARLSYESALQLQPENPLDLVGLGVVAQKTGELGRAIDYYSRAVKAQPSDIGFLLLAQSLEKSGQMAGAKAAFERAQDLTKNLEVARQRMERLLSDEQVGEPALAPDLKDQGFDGVPPPM
jgi:tetratricopeptide (TPR) repeat protein